MCLESSSYVPDIMLALEAAKPWNITYCINAVNGSHLTALRFAISDWHNVENDIYIYSASAIAQTTRHRTISGPFSLLWGSQKWRSLISSQLGKLQYSEWKLQKIYWSKWNAKKKQKKTSIIVFL